MAGSSEGYLHIVKLLLRCPKTDVTKIDGFGSTAQDNSRDNPDILLAFKKQPTLLLGAHTCCLDGNNELLRAAQSGNHRAIKGLGQCPNVDINTNDIKGRTSLYFASWRGHAKAVRELLNVPQIDVNKGRYLDGKSALSIAAEKGHFEVMRLLIHNNHVNMNGGWFFDSWPSLVLKDHICNECTKETEFTDKILDPELGKYGDITH